MIAELQPVIDSTALIRPTAAVAFALWALGVLAAGTRRGRWLAFAGWVMLALHFAAVFQFVHGWSHTAAFEQVRAQAGFGEGIFVSYATLLFWGIDAAWGVIVPASYQRRPRWMGRFVDGFLAFVFFNATVVYASSPVRWAALVAFVVLAVAVLRNRNHRGG